MNNSKEGKSMQSLKMNHPLLTIEELNICGALYMFIAIILELHPWLISKTVLDNFIKIINESYCKPNKLKVDQGKKLYNKPVKECLDANDILIYSN